MPGQTEGKNMVLTFVFALTLGLVTMALMAAQEPRREQSALVIPVQPR